MANQYTPRPSDIPRPDEDDLQLTIMNMMLNEKQSVLDVVNWLRYTSGYNYGKTYAYQLVKDTNDEVSRVWNETAKNTVENASASLHKDRAEAIKRGDFRLAFDILKEINKITQLYKENIDISGEVVIRTAWGK
jgi:hypothetical protein